MKESRKKILAIGPALHQWSDYKSISNSFDFLSSKYQIDFVDSLANITRKMSKDLFFSTVV